MILTGFLWCGFSQPILAQSISLEPVILVPGIMGSWNWKVLLGGSNPDLWNFFVIDHTWDNMISALEGAGYEKDKTLFIAFYDWRQSNIISATDYLIPTIDKALVNSTTGKVDIVAHSMGGLVARRYIQSNDYRDDVDQLIMLGTPNYGSSDVYTLWEGGTIPDNWDKKDQVGIKILLWLMTNFSVQTADNYDTVHNFIPSVGELLPTYDFLIDSENNPKSYGTLIEAKNPFLEDLNFSGTGINLQELGGITVIAGNGKNTVANIPVVDQPASETKLWKDGMPEPFPPARNSAEGDNRVLLSSAFVDDIVFPIFQSQNFWQKLFAKLWPQVYAAFDGENKDEFLKEKEINSKHGDLPTNAITDVFTALALPEPTVAYVPPLEPESITSFWFASPVEVKITDPNGKTITKDLNNIPGAVYTGENDPKGVKMIIIPNGLSGNYKIELLGLDNGEYHMAVTNFTDTDENIITVRKDVTKDEKIEYTATINPENPSPVEISQPTITKPVSDSAIKLTEDLIAIVDAYYKSGAINNKTVYQSLLNSLKIVLAALKEAETTRLLGSKFPAIQQLKVILAKKLAVAELNKFISQVKTQEQKKKITNAAATDMILKAENIISKIRS